MFDASGKVPDGLAAGNTFVLGSYEACVKVRSKATLYSNRLLFPTTF